MDWHGVLLSVVQLQGDSSVDDLRFVSENLVAMVPGRVRVKMARLCSRCRCAVQWKEFSECVGEAKHLWANK